MITNAVCFSLHLSAELDFVNFFEIFLHLHLYQSTSTNLHFVGWLELKIIRKANLSDGKVLNRITKHYILCCADALVVKNCR